MKYLLLVHHNEEAFSKMPEGTRKEMLAESIRLCTSSLPRSNMFMRRRYSLRRREPSSEYRTASR